MNRRGFFRALAATAVVTLAQQTGLGKLAPIPRDPRTPEIEAEIGRQYAEALMRSMLETKETLAANILNSAYNRVWLEDDRINVEAIPYEDIYLS